VTPGFSAPDKWTDHTSRTIRSGVGSRGCRTEEEAGGRYTTAWFGESWGMQSTTSSSNSGGLCLVMDLYISLASLVKRSLSGDSRLNWTIGVSKQRGLD